MMMEERPEHVELSFPNQTGARLVLALAQVLPRAPGDIEADTCRGIQKKLASLSQGTSIERSNGER
jgi:hypothetical protein